jgi:hypothetical protein
MENCDFISVNRVSTFYFASNPITIILYYTNNYYTDFFLNFILFSDINNSIKRRVTRKNKYLYLILNK